MNEIERAELIQSLKAYLIPTSMFIACLFGAAGTFLIREGELIGWAFIALTVIILVASFVAFITFQNKLRYDGKFVDEDKTGRKSAGAGSSIPNATETASSATVSGPVLQSQTSSQTGSLDSSLVEAGGTPALPGEHTVKATLTEETFDASPEKEAALKKG